MANLFLGHLDADKSRLGPIDPNHEAFCLKSCPFRSYLRPIALLRFGSLDSEHWTLITSDKGRLIQTVNLLFKIMPLQILSASHRSSGLWYLKQKHWTLIKSDKGRLILTMSLLFKIMPLQILSASHRSFGLWYLKQKHWTLIKSDKGRLVRTISIIV